MIASPKAVDDDSEKAYCCCFLLPPHPCLHYYLPHCQPHCWLACCRLASVRRKHTHEGIEIKRDVIPFPLSCFNLLSFLSKQAIIPRLSGCSLPARNLQIHVFHHMELISSALFEEGHGFCFAKPINNY